MFKTALAMLLATCPLLAGGGLAEANPDCDESGRVHIGIVGVQPGTPVVVFANGRHVGTIIADENGRGDLWFGEPGVVYTVELLLGDSGVIPAGEHGPCEPVTSTGPVLPPPGEPVTGTAGILPPAGLITDTVGLNPPLAPESGRVSDSPGSTARAQIPYLTEAPQTQIARTAG